MSILLAVNGVVETYPVTGGGIRPAPVVSAGPQEEKLKHDRSLVAAQTAYEQQQARHEHSAKPAILAKDLMTTPVITLPSDSTLADAWAVMQRRSFRHLPVTSLDGTLVGMVSDRDLL